MTADSTFFNDPTKVHFDLFGIASLGEYRGWARHKEAGGDGTNWPTHSINVLDFKKGKAAAATTFLNQLDALIASNITIAVVPSHDPETKESAIRKLARELASTKGRADATHCLVRHKKIAKLAGGGDRSMQVQMESLRLDDDLKIAWKNVLLLDDVTTSGNSLLACQKILSDGLAAKIQCLALGRTT